MSLDLSEEGENKRTLAREERKMKILDERLGTQHVSLEFSSILDFDKVSAPLASEKVGMAEEIEYCFQSLKKNSAAEAA